MHKHTRCALSHAGSWNEKNRGSPTTCNPLNARVQVSAEWGWRLGQACGARAGMPDLLPSVFKDVGPGRATTESCPFSSNSALLNSCLIVVMTVSVSSKNGYKWSCATVLSTTLGVFASLASSAHVGKARGANERQKRGQLAFWDEVLSVPVIWMNPCAHHLPNCVGVSSVRRDSTLQKNTATNTPTGDGGAR